MVGKLCVVTGASAGIGRETARGLARLGADVVLVGRNRDRLTSVADGIGATSDSTVWTETCDFARLDDVRALADRLGTTHGRVDVLVNNAGQILLHREETPDGNEAIFAVNHLAPYLLTRLLLPRLLESAPSRVVTVSSDAHRWGQLDGEDLMWTARKYKPMTVYGTSKLANALFAFELARRTTGTGVTSNAVHPGFVSSSLGRDNFFGNIFLKLARPFVRSPVKGAETSIYLASAPAGGKRTGEFWVDCKVVEPAPQARDVDLGRWLWDVSADLVGLPRE